MKKLTEKEWVEAFEEIHNRKPSSTEFMEGLKKGDFQILETPRKNLQEARPNSPFNKIRYLSELNINHRTILCMTIVFFALMLLSFVLYTNRIPFNQANFEEGEWISLSVPIEKDDNESYTNETVTYSLRYWSEDEVEVEVRSDYSDFLKSINSEDYATFVRTIQNVTGSTNSINFKKVNLIAVDRTEKLYYWINKDIAVVIDEFGFVSLMKKAKSSMLFGDYDLIDFEYWGNDTSVGVHLNTSLKEGQTLDFVGKRLYFKGEKFLMPYVDFIDAFTMAGHDIEQVKNSDELEEFIEKAGYSLDEAKDIFVALEIGEGKNSIGTGIIFIEVNNGKVLLIPLSSESSTYSNGLTDKLVKVFQRLEE